MTEMFRKPTTEVNESIKSKLFLDQKSGSKTSARLSPQSQLFFGIVELGQYLTIVWFQVWVQIPQQFIFIMLTSQVRSWIDDQFFLPQITSVLDLTNKFSTIVKNDPGIVTTDKKFPHMAFVEHLYLGKIAHRA